MNGFHFRRTAGRRPAAATLVRTVAASALIGLIAPSAVSAQAGRDDGLPSIEAMTEGMEQIDGYMPLYWDEADGRVWMEISRFDTEVLHVAGLSAGLGSNDIGLDRGRLLGSRIVTFDRVGPKVLMVQPNYRYRANSDNAAEVRAVEDAFAPSVLWGFEVAAESGGRVLVDATPFLMDAGEDLGRWMRPGSYRLDESRSAVYEPMLLGFPQNTELEVTLTFVRQPGGQGGGTGRFFEGVGDVAATGDAATVRMHHSFIQPPDDGYEPRRFDPRAGFFPTTWEDYAVPLGTSLTQRFINRHRLEKKNPGAAVSEPVEPIVYYLDPGVPEPVRSALMEGASWWNQAFEAAGYEDAFQVRLLPEDAHPLDIRYNVINWVHRSTRGWSYGSSVTDPRTGEIIKGVVTLGSLRVRQDYLIAEGLLSPYEGGDETPPELAEWALARIRQLSAHEVGHTIGLGHNYYDSRLGRISVMDYPHPLVRLNEDGTLDHSEVYEHGIGEWDSVAVTWGYQDFPDGVDEDAALQQILDDAWDRDIIYLTNQDIRVTPNADQWSNGTDPAAKLDQMMRVRRVALDRFGETAIKSGEPLATIEEVLVPLYLRHRFQIEAAASALGGLDFIYAMRGDGREPMRRVPASEQNAALDALLATIRPSELTLPRELLDMLPPRPPGWRAHREMFPRHTGAAFDAVTPAMVAADLVVANILDEERAARMVEQRALDPSLPGLGGVIDRLIAATFDASPADAYEAEVGRAAERVLVDRLMDLARRAEMPQVRAVATMRLANLRNDLADALGAEATMAYAARPGDGDRPAPDEADAAHYAMLVSDVDRFLDRPAEAWTPPSNPAPPPGAPIGQPAMDWLGTVGPACTWMGPLPGGR